jgi:hypothetical protein
MGANCIHLELELVYGPGYNGLEVCMSIDRNKLWDGLCDEEGYTSPGVYVKIKERKRERST